MNRKLCEQKMTLKSRKNIKNWKCWKKYIENEKKTDLFLYVLTTKTDIIVEEVKTICNMIIYANENLKKIKNKYKPKKITTIHKKDLQIYFGKNIDAFTKFINSTKYIKKH